LRTTSLIATDDSPSKVKKEEDKEGVRRRERCSMKIEEEHTKRIEEGTEEGEGEKEQKMRKNSPCAWKKGRKSEGEKEREEGKIK
jgi:hypothetical protein